MAAQSHFCCNDECEFHDAEFGPDGRGYIRERGKLVASSARNTFNRINATAGTGRRAPAFRHFCDTCANAIRMSRWHGEN
jgi:hypothetical protein